MPSGNTISISDDDAWRLGTYPGDESQAPFDVRLAVCDPSAKLTANRWQAIAQEAEREGHDADAVAVLVYGIQCEDIAARVQNPDGEQWTPATVRKVAAGSLAAFEWLRSELFGAAPETGAAHSSPSDSTVCAALLTSILPWRPETAGHA